MIGIGLDYGSDDDNDNDDMIIDNVVNKVKEVDDNPIVDKLQQQQNHHHHHHQQQNQQQQEQPLKYINEIPSAPSNESLNPITIERIKDYIEKKQEEGFDLTESIRSKKIFGNPYILSSVVQHFGIQEYGSEYPIDKWDPMAYQNEDYEEEIKRRYNNDNSNEIQNTNPSAPIPIPVPITTTIPTQQLDNITQNIDDNNKRKSRWN